MLWSTRLSRSCSLCLLLLLAACAGLPPTPSQPATSPPSPVEPSPADLPTATAAPTETPTPSSTATATTRATATASPTEGECVFPCIYVSERTATAAWRGIPTPVERTAVPVDAGNSFHQDLTRLGYTEYYGASIPGQDGWTYSAYIYMDASEWEVDALGNKPKFPDYNQRNGDKSTEGCRVAFYGSNGTETVLLRSFEPPKYDDTVDLAYPSSCYPYYWDADFYEWYTSWWFRAPEPETYLRLAMNGPWSDINQNGFPEFAVLYHYCYGYCTANFIIHFYEIRSTSEIVDITADLPGAIDVFYVFHSDAPLELYVYDRSYDCCYTFWIYAWDGSRFVDVTSHYPDEIRKLGNEKLAEIRKLYGTEWGDIEKMAYPLYQYEKAGLRQEGLDAFLEVSDPAHWTPKERDPYFFCSLQLNRAAMQEAYRLEKPFPPPIGFFLFMSESRFRDTIPEVLSENDSSAYDTSACLPFLPTPTP